MAQTKKKLIKRSEIKGYQVINLSKTVPTYPSFKKDIKGWIKYGEDNLLPQRIIDLNNESAINKSIIENKVTYICGSGVRDESGYYGNPNPRYTWDDLIEYLARDYVTFGGFCFQIISNKDGLSVSIYHTDFSKIRVGSVDDFGTPQSFFLSNDWSQTMGKYAPVEIKAYGVEERIDGIPYLFYYKDYEPSLDFYPIPSYYSALNYIEADGLLGKFYRNSIHNGFAPSVIITIPGNPHKDIKEQFNKDIKSTFTGTNGANAIVVLYGESQEIKPVITPFEASNNADLYNNVNDIIFQKLISAHRLTSPTLAGLSGSGNLSGNANEIINSYVLYNSTVIHKLRRRLLDTLNVFVRNNGYQDLRISDIDIASQINDNSQDAEINNIIQPGQSENEGGANL